MGSAKHLRLMIAVPLLLVSTSLVSAQTVGIQAPGTPGVGSGTGFVHDLPACPPAQELAQVVVTQAFKKTSAGEESTAQLGDEITLGVQHFKTLLQKATCTTPQKHIVLFLDGRPVKEVTPFPPTDPEKPFVIFPLKRTEQSREVWTAILGNPTWNPRQLRVSVGLEDEYAVESHARIWLEVIPHGWFMLWLCVFAGLLIGFLALAVKSDVLRDPGLPLAGGVRKPYSLSRTQAAWWLFLVLASYLFIGIITGDFSTTITGTVLGLVGISAGTVAGAAVIDAGKPPTPALPGDPASPPQNEYWWMDIISDANGVCFHRFQIATWTFVLGLIFIAQVYKVLAMPTFDGSLLVLLGISAGTYLGLKIPEPT